MSASGQSRGLADVRDMSDVAPIADIKADIDFGREVPLGDICQRVGFAAWKRCGRCRKFRQRFASDVNEALAACAQRSILESDVRRASQIIAQSIARSLAATVE